jgi:3',5'-cyclic AMP phosphodiesterase CpdA
LAKTTPAFHTDTTILHASDLHFGAHIPEMLSQFANFANRLRPQLVILSGDLTDGGRATEYSGLAPYLRTFVCPVFIVPGNHDAPVDNPFTRIMSPFTQFDALSAHKNSFHSAGLEVAELRTAGPVQARFDWSKGVATQRRVDRALGSFTGSRSPSFNSGPKPWQIVVGHHPLVDAPHVIVPGDVIGGTQALHACATFGADLVLSGHTHQSWFGMLDMHTILLGTAPTLSSPRIRGEGQGFHAYSFSDHEVLCDVWRWDVTDFTIETSKVHLRRGDLHPIGEPTNT